MLGGNTIYNYYTTMFSLVQHHKYSLTELESMLPYELEIYVNLLMKHLEEVKKQEQQKTR